MYKLEILVVYISKLLIAGMGFLFCIINDQYILINYFEGNIHFYAEARACVVCYVCLNHYGGFENVQIK
jgi:hypothetical protein